MMAGLFTAALLFLLAGFLIPLAIRSDRRILRTISYGCTLFASVFLVMLSLPVLIGSGTIIVPAYVPAGLFSIGFIIDRLAAFFL
ncbi:MAG TPA: hydrogenase membrane subunit, partial [Methanoregulaceae archaeon]|nr:hydrogenase membrane subunit [Methanoregulaceae archaeon]